jgi:hypothetical protein
MAFFDFDRRVQTFLIAGALASAGGCGGSVDIDGATDATVHDTVDAHEADADVPATCPEPGTWAVEISEDAVAWPTMTLRVSIDVPEEYLDESMPVFTVERKSVESVTRISDTEYEVVYLWEGPVESWGDWDRLHVEWTVACVDAEGRHGRVLEAEQLICVMEGGMWLGLGTEPMDCMMVDPAPYRLEEWREPEEIEAPSPAVPPGRLETRLESWKGQAGAIRLLVRPSCPPGEATFEWSASAGTIRASGPLAVWYPPAGGSVHVVQVATRTPGAVSVDAFRSGRA